MTPIESTYEDVVNYFIGLMDSVKDTTCRIAGNDNKRKSLF